MSERRHDAVLRLPLEAELVSQEVRQIEGALTLRWLEDQRVVGIVRMTRDEEGPHERLVQAAGEGDAVLVVALRQPVQRRVERLDVVRRQHVLDRAVVGPGVLLDEVDLIDDLYEGRVLHLELRDESSVVLAEELEVLGLAVGHTLRQVGSHVVVDPRVRPRLGVLGVVKVRHFGLESWTW